VKKNEAILLLVLFLFAFTLRFYDLSYPDFKWMDEGAHVSAAIHYWNDGQFEPDNWEHPSLRHILLYGFLKLFGDNPFGWRMRNVLAGAIAVVLTYLFARQISGSGKTALMAGLLLAVDPLHIVLSRYTCDEVYGGAFFLAAVVLYLKYAGTLKAGDTSNVADAQKQNMRFVLSAFFMGCTLAIKWSFVPGWIVVLALAFFQKTNSRDLRSAVFVSSIYLLVPLSVYMLSYYQWFGRGYTVKELMELAVNSYYSLQLYTSETYIPGMIFLSYPSASEWFVRPIVVGQGTYLNAHVGEFILFVNNLPIWILTIPSMIGLAIVAARKKSMAIALPVVFFCASYMLFLLVRRPVFLYSSVPLLPFAFTAIAFLTVKLSDRFSAKLYYAVLVLMLSWSLLLYPLVTAKKVPIALYRYILDDTHIIIN